LRRRNGRRLLGKNGLRCLRIVRFISRQGIAQHGFAASGGGKRLVDAQFGFGALGGRRLLLRLVQQDILVMRLEQRLGQFALAVFLPFVVGEHTDHRHRAQANQSHLEFGHLSRIPHLQSFLDIHFHHTRNTGFLHGDADQLLGHFHRDFIMGNEQELCCT